jgi:mannose-6-phosphate isomerase-like protein (cupin superfamily)
VNGEAPSPTGPGAVDGAPDKSARTVRAAGPMTEIEREADHARRAGGYSEFLRVPAMSAGTYVLGAGATDRQTPHTEDEIYYVVRGRGRFQNRDEDHAVGPGDVLFVPARRPHRFHSITEELVLLVVFAPAEQPPP